MFIPKGQKYKHNILPTSIPTSQNVTLNITTVFQVPGTSNIPVIFNKVSFGKSVRFL